MLSAYMRNIHKISQVHIFFGQNCITEKNDYLHAEQMQKWLYRTDIRKNKRKYMYVILEDNTARRPILKIRSERLKKTLYFAIKIFFVFFFLQRIGVSTVANVQRLHKYLVKFFPLMYFYAQREQDDEQKEKPLEQYTC